MEWFNRLPVIVRHPNTTRPHRITIKLCVYVCVCVMYVGEGWCVCVSYGCAPHDSTHMHLILCCFLHTPVANMCTLKCTHISLLSFFFSYDVREPFGFMAELLVWYFINVDILNSFSQRRLFKKMLGVYLKTFIFTDWSQHHLFEVKMVIDINLDSQHAVQIKS